MFPKPNKAAQKDSIPPNFQSAATQIQNRALNPIGISMYFSLFLFFVLIGFGFNSIGSLIFESWKFTIVAYQLLLLYLVPNLRFMRGVFFFFFGVPYQYILLMSMVHQDVLKVKASSWFLKLSSENDISMVLSIMPIVPKNYLPLYCVTVTYTCISCHFNILLFLPL